MIEKTSCKIEERDKCNNDRTSTVFRFLDITLHKDAQNDGHRKASAIKELSQLSVAQTQVFIKGLCSYT